MNIDFLYFYDVLLEKLKETPLIIASRIGNIDLVKELLSLGADMKAKDYSGRNCLEVARKYKNGFVADAIAKYAAKKGFYAVISK